MKIEPLNGSAWYGEGVECEGRVELASLTAKQLRMIGAAESAGAIKVTGATKDERATMAKGVMSDADWTKAQAQAAADGSWQYGSHEAFLVYAQALLEQLDEQDPAFAEHVEAIYGDKLETVRANLEAGVTVSEAYLNARDDGHNHENAVRIATQDDPVLVSDEVSDEAMRAHARAVSTTPTVRTED